MSYKVTEAFIEQSRSKHGARTVGLIIAEVAHHDGVGWIRIEPSKAKRPRILPADDVDNIVFRTKLSAKQVRRCIDRLQDLDEIEVVRAWDGRNRYYVYRLIIEPMRLREVDYARGGLSVIEAPFWTPEELREPLLERRVDGHEYSPTQAARLGFTSGQYVPSSAVAEEAARGDIGPPDEGTSAQPPIEEPVLDPVQTEEANASSVPADAGERDLRKSEIALALTAALGVQVRDMTRRERGGWELVIAELADVGASQDDVVRRCVAFREMWPTMKLTPLALSRHWALLGAKIEAKSPSTKLGQWIESAVQFDREMAHELLDDRPGLDENTRAKAHASLDARFDRLDNEREQAA